jgi:heme exporter protein A
MWKDLVLEAKSLACERGGRTIFRELNFAVKSGEAVELRGPNGAGKSSLLRLIAGLNRPAAGTLTLGSTPHEIAELSHYIGHQEAIKPALSVRENLDFWSRFMGGTTQNALVPFKLERLADDEAALLSEGQRRRLALSRLIAVKRPIWLLDEPTVGLDVTALEDLRKVMQSHLNGGGLIIAATHASLGLATVGTLTIGASH